MVFTSSVFLGVFLPLLLAVYFLSNQAARAYVLLVFSLVFYAWGEPSAALERVNGVGRVKLNPNPLVEGVETDREWSVDSDISELLNIWDQSRILANVHLQPRFQHEGRVMNEGSAYILGDCYRDQFKQILGEAGVFKDEKIVTSKRQGETPDRLRPIARDLKLVLLTFQSFNTGKLYDRVDELDSILTALKRARDE